MPSPRQAICVRPLVEGPPHPHHSQSLASVIATKSSATPNVRSPRQAEMSPSAFHYVGSSGHPSLTAQRVGVGGEGFASNHSSILTLHNTTVRDATPTQNNNACYSTTVRDGGVSPASSLRLAAGGTLVSLGESDGTNGGGAGGVGRAATLKSFSSVAEVRSRQHMSGSKHTSLIYEEKSSQVHTAEVSEQFELLPISHPKEVAEEKVTTTAKKRRQLCTIPLLSVYIFQCIIVIAAFCSIIAYAHVRIDATATSLIENSIEVALTNAALEVYGPLQALEEQLLEYRSRYYADGVVNKLAKFPCNDYNLSSLLPNATGDVLSLQDSVAFYSDQLLTMGTLERIVASFVATQISTTDDIDWSNKSSYADIQSLISHCSVSKSSLFRRYGNLSKMTLRVPNISEVGDLDSLPVSHGPSPSGYGTHEDQHILMILRSTALISTPFIHPGQGLFMLFTTPTHYAVINSTNGQRSTYAEERMPISNFLGRSDVLQISVLSGMGIAASMTDYVDILLAITPDGAFTSLYDLTNNIVLASTQYAPDEQYDKASGTLYGAGRASSVLLNRYFYESKVMDLPPDTSRIDFDGSGGRVIAAKRFDMPVSGTVYGIVQTIPSEYYYGPINRLRSIMIGLGVICCLLVVATCVCIAIGIFRGIEQLLANMALAAAMKNDQTTYIRTFITDVDRLAKGFGSMNDRLLVARAYLPQHLLLSYSSDESGFEEEEGDYDEGEGDAQRSNTARGTQQSKEGTEGGTRSRRTTSLASQTSTFNKHSVGGRGNEVSSSDADQTTKGKRRNVLRDKADAPKKGGAAVNSGGAGVGSSHGVTAKRVTILTINARGFHKFIDVKQPFTVVAGVMDITEAIAQAAQAHKGVIDSFHGDHFVISFNAARSCSEGPAKAAACALTVADAACNRRQYVTMGLSCGRACVGHLGTSTMKRLSIVGSVYSRAMTLGRVCYRFNPPLPTGSDTKTVLDGKTIRKAKKLAAYGDEEDDGDSEEDDDAYGRDGKVADAAEDVRRLMSIQLIADESVVSDIQHIFELQLLGGLYGSPYSCAPLVEDDIPAPRPHHTTVRSEGRPLDPAGGGEDMVGSFGSEQQQSDAHRSGQQILGVGLGGGGAQSDQHSTNGLTLVYAVRGYSNTREDSEADEWLYELAASKSSLLADINSAFETYITSLPSARIPPPLGPFTHQNLHHHHNTLSSQSNNGNLTAETKVVVFRTPGVDSAGTGPTSGPSGMAAATPEHTHTKDMNNYRRYAQCVFDLSAKLASVRNRLHPTTTDGLSSDSGVEGGSLSERDELVLSALRYAEGISRSSAHSPHRRGRKLSSPNNTCCCGHCGEEPSRLRGNRMSSLEPAYTAAGCFFTGVNRAYK